MEEKQSRLMKGKVFLSRLNLNKKGQFFLLEQHVKKAYFYKFRLFKKTWNYFLLIRVSKAK